MSRYDGLIIPRSYSEYINKTDAATLSQALQLSGVLDSAPTEDSDNPVKSNGIYDALATKQNTLTFDDAPTAGSNNPVKSSGIYKAIDEIAYDSNITDCNNAYETGKTRTYVVPSEATNVPNNTTSWYILAQCNPTTWSSNKYVTQIATNGADNSKTDIYIRHAYKSGSSIAWTSWEKVITPKVKEVTGTTSANGNLQLNLAGATNVVIAVQTSNSQGNNNDMIAIPYKLGDGTPDTNPTTGGGRWGVHCIAANGSNTVQVNTDVYLTVFYYER